MTSLMTSLYRGTQAELVRVFELDAYEQRRLVEDKHVWVLTDYEGGTEDKYVKLELVSEARK